MLGHKLNLAHAEDLPVEIIQASVVVRIDGIGIALNHIAKMVETIYGVVNVDLFAVHVNDVAAVYGIRDTGVNIL